MGTYILCIDNNISRSRVLSNIDFNIKVVPTIILIDNDIKIYEGENANDYITQIYKNINSLETHNMVDNKTTLLKNIIQEKDNLIENKNDNKTTLIENIIQEKDNENENKNDNKTTLLENIIQESDNENENKNDNKTTLLEKDDENESGNDSENKSDLMSLVESMQKEREDLEKNKE